jgi:Zn finger protein HypA/HybF involved in hydrogenase expression/predicted GIY-YIG superfamily endonuclease
MKLIVGKNDLATTHPELGKEADGWDPKTVTAGTNKKLQWKCKKGHSWIAPGSRRTIGSGCPVCENRQVLVGYNDLATTHPELAKQADGWDPKKVIAGTGKKLNWKCSEKHKWEASGNTRVKGIGCPVCSNQKLLVGYNDLATTHPELAKQADGWDPKKVIAGTHKKLQWRCKKNHIWSAPGSGRKAGDGCPVCDNKQVLVGYNDLATTHPEFAKEADGWDPKKIITGSHKRLNWKCKSGHTWVATAHSRQNCPVCSNQKLLVGYNDLATTHPELAKQADGWNPEKVIAGTHKKLRRKCTQGHVWTATGSGRSRGIGCPVCSNQKLLVGYNDLATTHPELAKQADGWDPKKVIAGTQKKLRWKCSEGHKWETAGSVRTSGSNCPSCATSGFNPNQNAFVYFLIQPIWELYQIGITNDFKERFKRHKKNGFELLELRGPMDGQTAQELETAILRFLKSQKADLSPEQVAGKFDGFTESWTIDSYKVNNLKELIDKTSEAGF